MSKELQQLGLVIQRERLKAGLTQRELAARLGISHAGVGRIEAGYERGRATPETLARLSRILDLDYEELYALRQASLDALPALPVYLRNRYGLGTNAAKEVENYVQRLQAGAGEEGGRDGS